MSLLSENMHREKLSPQLFAHYALTLSELKKRKKWLRCKITLGHINIMKNVRHQLQYCTGKVIFNHININSVFLRDFKIHSVAIRSAFYKCQTKAKKKKKTRNRISFVLSSVNVTGNKTLYIISLEPYRRVFYNLFPSGSLTYTCLLYRVLKLMWHETNSL